MTPKQKAMKDFMDGEFTPDAPIHFTNEEKDVYYKEFLALVNAENKRLHEELRGGV